MQKRELLTTSYFLTWTTYGTWLPGDARGSKSRKTNPFGFPDITPNPLLVEYSRRQMKQKPYMLDVSQREVVKSAITSYTHKKSLELIAVQIRSNHIHIAIAETDLEPMKLISNLKRAISYELKIQFNDAAGFKHWSRGGHFKIIENEEALIQIIDYIVNEQGEKIEFYIAKEYQYLLR